MCHTQILSLVFIMSRLCNNGSGPDATLATAEQSVTLMFKSGHVQHSRPCSLVSCNLWQCCRPTFSPYASNHVVISPIDVLCYREDYLPVKPYNVPAADPDKPHRSAGGRTDIEMVYVVFDEVNLKLMPDERSYMEAWKLNITPLFRLPMLSRYSGC